MKKCLKFILPLGTILFLLIFPVTNMLLQNFIGSQIERSISVEAEHIDSCVSDFIPWRACGKQIVYSTETSNTGLILFWNGTLSFVKKFNVFPNPLIPRGVCGPGVLFTIELKNNQCILAP